MRGFYLADTRQLNKNSKPAHQTGILTIKDHATKRRRHPLIAGQLMLATIHLLACENRQK
jgi:hypothetical protein